MSQIVSLLISQHAKKEWWHIPYPSYMIGTICSTVTQSIGGILVRVTLPLVLILITITNGKSTLIHVVVHAATRISKVIPNVSEGNVPPYLSHEHKDP